MESSKLTIFLVDDEGPTPSILSIVHYSQTIALKTSVTDSEMTNADKIFWGIESIGVSETEEREADPVMMAFKDIIRINEERYEFGLSWASTDHLEMNQPLAKQRLYQLT